LIDEIEEEQEISRQEKIIKNAKSIKELELLGIVVDLRAKKFRHLKGTERLDREQKVKSGGGDSSNR
jgi:biotin operon repressor